MVVDIVIFLLENFFYESSTFWETYYYLFVQKICFVSFNQEFVETVLC